MNRYGDNIEWNMAQDYYGRVAEQIWNCTLAQRAAKADPTQYDEWYEELKILTSLMGGIVRQKGTAECMQKWIYKAEKAMGINTSFQFNLDLSNDAKKRKEVHDTLYWWQSELLVEAGKNKLLDHRVEYDKTRLKSRV